MGNKTSTKDMPQDLRDKCLELFRKIDVDGSKSIDKQETMKFWGSKFAQLNSDELFASVDKNDDGSNPMLAKLGIALGLSTFTKLLKYFWLG